MADLKLAQFSGDLSCLTEKSEVMKDADIAEPQESVYGHSTIQILDVD